MSNRLVYSGSWSFPVKKQFVLDPSLSIGAKMLYLALKSYCSPEDDTAFPSAETLSVGLGVSKETVYKYAAELEEAKLLNRHQEKSSGGRFSHTVYTLFDECREGFRPCTENTVTGKTASNKLVPIISECITKETIPPPSEASKENIASSSSAPTRMFSDGWLKIFKKRFGEDYKYSSRDAAAAVDLLKQCSAQVVLEIAEKAMSKKDEKKFFHCVKATLRVYSFRDKFLEIRNELGMLRRNSSEEVDYSIMPDAKASESSEPEDNRPFFERMRSAVQ